MLIKLAIWYLRIRNKSVVIGFNIKNGEMQQKNEGTYIYDNSFDDVITKGQQGEVYIIPEGPFKIKG